MVAHLILTGVSKRFGGVQALDTVALEANAGEVMGLIGENGAGKSTLVKILTGIHRPDAGTIAIDGVAHEFAGPREASDAGVSAIQQEPLMFDDLSVAENIFVAAQPGKGRLRLVDWRRMHEEAERLLAEIGVPVATDEVVRNLGIAERHMVSLGQALATDARLIIFDEPTAALSQAEIRHLYGIIEKLKARGKAIIFISHKFDEIFRICDRYTVLRDGRDVGTGRIADVTEDDLIRLMVGRTLKDIYPKTAVEIGEVVLSVEGFSHPTEFDDIGFEVRRGEILGFYGLVGAGRTEVMEAIFGLKARSGGTVQIDGEVKAIASPSEAIAAGLAYVPEDRQRHGVVLPFSIAANMSLPQLGGLARWIFLDPNRERALADTFGEQVHIKTYGWEQAVSELSGGNQQKVVIGKWLATNPRVLILDEPTKGIDVGSKAAVHRTLGELAGRGLAVVLVSSELEEVLGMADRLVVMNRGRISARFARPEFSSEAVVAAAAGHQASEARA